MVKHGTAKKRRRNMKVTRKAPIHAGLKILKAAKTSAVKDVYDANLTPSENLKALGLDPNPNELRSKERKSDIERKSAGLVGFVSMKDIQLHEVDQREHKRIISNVEAVYAKDLIVKHSTNYKAMERDIKTNYRQLSENQAQKLCEKYYRHCEKSGISPL